MVGRCPIKWKQHPDMTMAIDWDTKPNFKQAINKQDWVKPEILSITCKLQVIFPIDGLTWII